MKPIWSAVASAEGGSAWCCVRPKGPDVVSQPAIISAQVIQWSHVVADKPALRGASFVEPLGRRRPSAKLNAPRGRPPQLPHANKHGQFPARINRPESVELTDKTPGHAPSRACTPTILRGERPPENASVRWRNHSGLSQILRAVSNPSFPDVAAVYAAAVSAPMAALICGSTFSARRIIERRPSSRSFQSLPA
jgi:hypothetical protein